MAEAEEKYCPFNGKKCDEKCALYLKDVGIASPGGRLLQPIDGSTAIKSIATGCAFVVMATN